MRSTAKTYFLSVVEQHVGREVVYANLRGDVELIGLAVRQVVAQLDPDQVYEVVFYGNDRPFGANTEEILSDVFVGATLVEVLTAKVAELAPARSAAEPGE